MAKDSTADVGEINLKSGVKDLTKGNILSSILMFALPIFISGLFQQLYNTADALIVGKFLGTNSLAAVSSSGTLIFLLISFFEGAAMGGGIVISKCFGAKSHKQVKDAISTLILLGLICGVFLTVVGVFLTPVLLKWMNTDPEVLPEAVEYFRYYFLGSLAVVMYNISRSIMTSLGDSKRPLYYLIISSVTNCILDILFVGVFSLGVWSAAVATVISQLLSVILCFKHLMSEKFPYRIEIRKLRMNRHILGEIIRYGLPSGVQNSVIGFANVMVQSQVNTFGRFATAAYGTNTRIEGFVFLPINSCCMAITTFISQNLGAKQYDRAKKGAKYTIFFAMGMSEIIGLLSFIFSPYLISVFDSTKEVIEYGVTETRIRTLFYFLLAFSHTIAAICRGAGKAKVPMYVMLSVWCVFRVIFIMTMMHFFGRIELVYTAYPITWFISSAIFLIYFLKSNWTHGFEQNEKKLSDR